MASMGVSKLGRMDLIFIDVRVKINGAYYREVLLLTLKQLREICSEFFIVQQGHAPTHRARGTIELLERETPAFISLDL